MGLLSKVQMHHHCSISECDTSITALQRAACTAINLIIFQVPCVHILHAYNIIGQFNGLTGPNAKPG